jgi:hypothetical protein
LACAVGASSESATWVVRLAHEGGRQAMTSAGRLNLFLHLLLKRLFLRPHLTITVMSVTRLKRKNRKDKAKSARRRTDLKNQSFQPVIKSVDIEKIKEEFKAKKAAAKK